MVSESSKNKQRQAVGQIRVNKQQTTDNYVIIFIINTAKYKQTVLSLRKTHPRMSVLKGHSFGASPSSHGNEARQHNMADWRDHFFPSSLPYSSKLSKPFGVFFVRLEHRERLSGNCEDSSV